VHTSGRLELSQKLKISVIDDDDLVREGIESLLRSLHHDVDTFASAAEHLEPNRVHDYSCIIADMQMPDMSGIDLQKRLSKDGFSIPIIFMSASPTEALTRRVMDAGAVGFLCKPFKIEYLIDYLGKALQKNPKKDSV
jgi:FixJ family two-component response regulator